ncbi:MAG: ABC transporter ATP-binding protein [Cyclobacteriaceae bacterium]|nr:ABC transporter ATP-binding protein [Cyclobacteriaceae bacterium]
MSEVAIKVEGIGKKYRIGKMKSGELRETFGNLLRSFKPGNSNQQPPTDSEFWALKDISFEVKKGEAVGIIGRNGAGKSTLLKVLSRITKPTTGRFEINGRVSSLLEVGTGFHPELTGRENIYLNGTILGMKRREIKLKFDEIVAFSGVEEFIDTPVKHYSSGMKVRLAFSVAAHLEPEILIIDEVLAVGDAEFQKKCLGKMEDVTGQGRTVLFVSHNMGAVERLCNYGIFLNIGEIIDKGTIGGTIQKYLTSFEKFGNNIGQRTDRNGNGEMLINKIVLKNELEQVIDQVHSGQSFSIELGYIKNVKENRDRTICSLSLKTNLGLPIFLIHNRMTNEPFNNLEESGSIKCFINKLPLTASTYYLSYSLIHDGKYLDSLENAIKLHVISGKFYNSTEIPPHSHSISLLNASWNNF